MEFSLYVHTALVLLVTKHRAALGREGKHENTYLHYNKEVKDQDKRGQERSGNFITGQKTSIQLIPADPVRCNDKYHHRSQSKENGPARNKTFIKEH